MVFSRVENAAAHAGFCGEIFSFFRDTFCSQNVWILRKKNESNPSFFLEKMRCSREVFQSFFQKKNAQRFEEKNKRRIFTGMGVLLL